MFGANKLLTQSNILTFTQGQDPTKHIDTCEKECKRLGYKDERIWPHLFPNTLNDLPNNWYKME